MTTQSHFGGTVTDPVAYSVNVDAQKPSTGWELTLDNGRQLQVTTLDEAATRIRTLLDIYQPAVNHDTVTVTLAISPTAAPAKTAAPSVAGASRTSARASAASSTTGARTPSATSAAARTTTSSAAVTPAASRSATSSRTATPSARTATSTQSTPVARPATTSRAPHTTTSPRTATQSPAASTRFSTTSSATSTPAAASARPATAPAASTRSASTRTTANPPATDYASVGPSGLECTLWLTAAKEKHPSFSDAAIEVFPWINTLPAEQRRRCLGDIHVGLKRATEEYAYSELRDTVSRWRKISAAPPVTPTAPHNEVRPTTSAPASPARSSFGNYPAAIHRISAAASRPATSAASAPHGSQGSPIDLNPQGRHRL